MKEEKKIKWNIDYTLLVIVVVLLAFGLVMLYSTSAYSSYVENNGDSTWYLRNQAKNTAIGVVAMLIVALFDYRFWKRFAVLGYILSIGLVFLVMTPLGIEANGARRWVGIEGVISFQPAEFAKIAMILFLAWVISESVTKIGKLKTIATIGFFVAIVVGSVAIVTSNLSTAIIIFGIAFTMLFIASPNTKVYIILAGLAVVAVIAFLQFGDGFRMERIEVWKNPEQYSQEGGYQVLQALYAIGSGGLFGKGFGQSVQKLGFIPEAQNDMIFTIICEELGLFGGIAVILMFGFLIWRLYVIAMEAEDLFGTLLVVGVMAHIAIQVILNIAVVTNTIPNTGITLPFISYGGTSVLFLLAEIGLALSVSRKK